MSMIFFSFLMVTYEYMILTKKEKKKSIFCACHLHYSFPVVIRKKENQHTSPAIEKKRRKNFMSEKCNYSFVHDDKNLKRKNRRFFKFKKNIYVQRICFAFHHSILFKIEIDLVD